MIKWGELEGNNQLVPFRTTLVRVSGASMSGLEGSAKPRVARYGYSASVLLLHGEAKGGEEIS